jgi:hypothetical protein
MNGRPKPTAVISRWHAAAEQTAVLLRENEELMLRRNGLYQRRAELFREILHAARGFVEEVQAGVSKRE